MMKQILSKFRRNKKITALFLGFATVVALPPFYQFYVLFITLSGLLLLIETSEKGTKAFGVGYWFGFGFFSLGLSWVGNALLIDNSTIWLYPLSFIGSGLFFGFFIAFPAYIAYKFRSTYLKYLVFCSTWVIFEWLRSFILTGFPWNLLGSVLAFDIRMLQLASIFGTYGLSLIVLLVCTAPALFLTDKDTKSMIISFAIILGITAVVFQYGNERTRKNLVPLDPEFKIRIVQPSIPQKFKWDYNSLENNFQEYIDMSKFPGLEDIDFVIWGETASPFALDMDQLRMDKVVEAIPEKGHLITGSIRYEYNQKDKFWQPANSLFVVNKDGGIEEFYDKSHLVPFGEYIPVREYLPDWVRPITKFVANFYQGEGLKTIAVEDYPEFGPLICYEVIFPGEVANKSNRPKWLVNVTNDGWYGERTGPYQHLVTTQLRAIEEGLTVVRVANTGVSALISYTGEIIDSIPLNKSAILDVNMPKKLSIDTIYGKHGNFLVVILFFANILMLFIAIRRKK